MQPINSRDEPAVLEDQSRFPSMRTDIMSAADRSEHMGRIRRENTLPEVAVRKALFALGFRYRLNDTSLPGKPDLVFPRYRAVIFVHGCFWHLHSCHLFKWPRGNAAFWREKLTRNRQRDRRVERALLDLGWRVMSIWECALRGRGKLNLDGVASTTATWLASSRRVAEISGDADLK